MVNINLDLVIQGRLDLRIAGSIGLLEDDGQKRSRIQHSERSPIQHAPPFPPRLTHREQEAAEQLGRDETEDAIDRLSRDEIEGDDQPSVENRSRPRRPLSRAARKTRQAIAGLRESLKSGETQRIQEATEHLRKAVLRLSEEVQRGADATALGGGY
jgi:hypothetical protein